MTKSLHYGQMAALCFIAATLSGCGNAVVKERIVKVNVPVTQPCVGERPAPVSSLKDEYTDAEWRGMDVRQKSAAVGKKGLERQAYGESLDAATGACQ